MIVFLAVGIVGFSRTFASGPRHRRTTRWPPPQTPRRQSRAIVLILTQTEKGEKISPIYCECCAYDKNHVECVVNRAKIFVLYLREDGTFACIPVSSVLWAQTSTRAEPSSEIGIHARSTNLEAYKLSAKEKQTRTKQRQRKKKVGKNRVHAFDINRSQNKRIGARKGNYTVLESAHAI